MKPYLIPFFATVALTATAQQKKRDYQRPRNTGCNQR